MKTITITLDDKSASHVEACREICKIMDQETTRAVAQKMAMYLDDKWTIAQAAADSDMAIVALALAGIQCVQANTHEELLQAQADLAAARRDYPPAAGAKP